MECHIIITSLHIQLGLVHTGVVVFLDTCYIAHKKDKNCTRLQQNNQYLTSDSFDAYIMDGCEYHRHSLRSWTMKRVTFLHLNVVGTNSIHKVSTVILGVKCTWISLNCNMWSMKIDVVEVHCSNNMQDLYFLSHFIPGKKLAELCKPCTNIHNSIH